MIHETIKTLKQKTKKVGNIFANIVLALCLLICIFYFAKVAFAINKPVTDQRIVQYQTAMQQNSNGWNDSDKKIKRIYPDYKNCVEVVVPYVKLNMQLKDQYQEANGIFREKVKEIEEEIEESVKK